VCMTEEVIQIPSSLQHIHVIEDFIERLRWDFEIDDCLFGNIHLAVVEAVTNAIVHGNKSDIQKQITFCFHPTKEKLRFRIKDEGTGFDPTCVPDPTLPENKTKINGRGVFLIKNLADNVAFQDN